MTGVEHVSQWVQRVWLGVILIVALALYLAGALPQVDRLHGGDEVNFIETALRMGSGVLQPFGLRHGTGLPLLLAAEFGLWYLVRAALGQMSQPLDVAWAYLRDPTIFVLLGRLTAACAGAGVIVLTWRLGRQLRSDLVGVLAAAFTGLSVLPATMVVRFKEELPALAFLLLGLECAAGLAGFGGRGRSTRRLAMWAGVWVGIAAAFKYTAGLGLAPIGLAAWWAARRQAQDSVAQWTAWVRYSLAAGLSSAAAFLVLSPSAVVHPLMLAQGLGDLSSGFSWFPQPTPPILTRLFRQVPDAVGLPMALLAVAGSVRLLRRQPRIGLLLLAYPVALLAALGPYVGVASHLIFAVPLLAITAAEALAVGVPAVVPGRTAARLALGAAAVLVVWPTYTDACRVVAIVRRPDTRTLALDWMRQHVPGGSRVLVEGARYAKIYFGPDLPTDQDSLEEDLRAIQAQGGYGRLAMMRLQLAQTHPPAVAFRVMKMLTASSEAVTQTEPDVVITSGYFDRKLFEDDPRGTVDVLPCNKPEVQQERRRLREALARGFAVRAVFDPGVRFHEEFPIMYGGDFVRLRQVPLWGGRRELYQGPVVTIYQRKASPAREG